MPGAQRMKAAQRSDVGVYEYLGGQTLTMDGSVQGLTIPSNASIIQVDVETAAVYYAINAPIASANSPGFIPINGGRVIGPLATLTALSLFGAAGGIAHVQYFRIV